MSLKRRTLSGTVAIISLMIVSVSFVAAFAGSVVASKPAYAAPANASVSGCSKSFFGLRPWYYYMNAEFTSSSAPKDKNGNQDPCEIKCFNIFPQNPANDCGQTKSDIPAVLLAVVDDLLRISGLVAVIFVLVGGFKYVLSEGNPEKTSEAKSSILNALIGMAVAMTAIAFISFVGSKLS